jgi:hypothetical protein
VAYGTRLAILTQRDRRLCLNGTDLVSNILRDLIIVGYASMVGFVVAGIVASFYKWVTSEPAKFMLLGQGIPALLTSFAFCAATGPIIVLDHVLRLRTVDKGPLSQLCAGIAVTAMWSCCSGIVFLSLVVALT